MSETTYDVAQPICTQCLKPLTMKVVYGSWWRAECVTKGCIDKGYVKPADALAEPFKS